MAVQRKGFSAPNDSILVKTAKAISTKEITSSATKKTIEKMLKFAYPEQGDRKKPVLVGLAAPQVKISKRIILVDVKADGHGKVGDLRVYVNPEITWKSKEKNDWYEGCFSTDRVCGIVNRPTKVRINAYNVKGELIEETHSGYIARIFQHEIDHLNGKEFVTHITDNEKLHWVEDGQFPQYRDKEAWRTWSVKCPREKWEKIKGLDKSLDKVHILIEGYARPGSNGSYIASPSTVLIETGKKKILVDPGANKEKLFQGLRKLKVKPQDINFIFLSHYHVDHILNLKYFPDHDVYDGTTKWSDDKEYFYQKFIPDTDIEILPTPGHSPEHSSLLVETKDGVVCTAQDVFWWEDGKQKSDKISDLLNLKDPFMNDKKALIQSRKLVLEKADWIIPGHGKMFKNPKRG